MFTSFLTLKLARISYQTLKHVDFNVCSVFDINYK
jgi:hypothetical protein